ncbi:MAG: hypothetical protein GYA58_03360 [Anaerolineaceae bacterium]|nr:hypothetical protein [Anaerolineaceae bacterium]
MKSMFQNRIFWVALLTLLVVVTSSFIPGFDLDVEHAAGLSVIAAGYVVAFAINPSGNTLAGMLTSRKFWASALGFVILLLDAFHVLPNPLNVASLSGFVVVIVAYVVALSYDPGNGWRGLLVSRKFYVAVVGVLITILDAFGLSLPDGITSESVISFAVLIGGTIAAIGLDKKPVPLPDPELPE